MLINREAPHLKVRGFFIDKIMNIKVIKLIPVIFLSLFFSLGMSPQPSPKVNLQTQEMLTRLIIEEFFQKIESAYAFEDLKGFMDLLDNKFDDKGRFKLVLSEYFEEVSNPHLHFVIDMVLSNKDRLSVMVHWYKNATTLSGAGIRLQGLTQLELHRYPDGLRIINIKRDNPFF